MKVGMLTGGGDCPGLNAVIRAVVKKGTGYGWHTVGVRNGWKGMLEASTMELSEANTSDMLAIGGTMIGTSRTNPFKDEATADRVVKNFREMGLDALVAIGGEDTLGAAAKLFARGLPVVGVPKTIDNDLSGTDFTFGFDTAVGIATEAIDRLHTTAKSHGRVLVCEIMGRHAGWITAYAGIAGGADITLVPEKPFDVDEVCASLLRQKAKGKNYAIVAVSEGAQYKTKAGAEVQAADLDEFGHVRLGGIADHLAKEIEKRTKWETRSVVLGHVQRGGTPTAHDRVLSTRFGIFAAELVHQGDFGKMAALQGDRIVGVSLSAATEKLKTVDMDLLAIAETFSG
jgi:phosphofructokinase-like protein